MPWKHSKVLSHIHIRTSISRKNGVISFVGFRPLPGGCCSPKNPVFAAVYALLCCHPIYPARQSILFDMCWRISQGHMGGRSTQELPFCFVAVPQPSRRGACLLFSSVKRFSHPFPSLTVNSNFVYLMKNRPPLLDMM